MKQLSKIFSNESATQQFYRKLCYNFMGKDFTVVIFFLKICDKL